jgi:tRNA(Ile)-lysidine synthase
VDDAALIARFDGAMAAAEPFEARPAIAVAVSGGADSMALALLADRWTQARQGRLLAFVVDHGIRPESAREADLTLTRLAACGVAGRLLTLTGLAKGPALAERARDERYRVLAEACAAFGGIHLLLGHHAADQAETMMIRVLSASGGRGLSGMAAVAETRALRLLRPLLTVPPAALRAFLSRRGVAWVEDPSNRDPTALRSRIRHLRADDDDTATQTLADAARRAGQARAANDAAVARTLAQRAEIRPEGFALLSPGPLRVDAMAALLRTIGGARFAPALDRIAVFAAAPAARTIAGVRVMPAGRLSNGWLLVREEAAIAPPVPAVDGALWDGRFRLRTTRPRLDETFLGAIGDAAPRLRPRTNLPSAVLRVMPGLWRRNILVAVPQLHYRDSTACDGVRGVVFAPPQPLSGAPFRPA